MNTLTDATTDLPNLYDLNHTRYRLVKSVPGNKMYNWLFVPGGPGVTPVTS